MIASALPEDVTWFSSDQPGVRQMMGDVNGGMFLSLDDCLVNGFGLKTSITVVSEPDYVIIDFDSVHGYLSNQIVEISGAVNPQLNGRHRIKSIEGTSIRVDVSGVVAEVDTGLSVKVASLGWESVFGITDPLKRAYRSKSASNSKRVLYLDMQIPSSAGYNPTNPPKRATVSVCDDMQILGEQIGSLTNAANNFITNPNGSLFWYQKRGMEKSGAVTSNKATRWRLVGNRDFFYLIISWSDSAIQEPALSSDVFGFGEFVGIGDAQDKTFLMAAVNNNDNDVIKPGTNAGKLSASPPGSGILKTSLQAFCFGSTNGGTGFNPYKILTGAPVTTGSVYTSGNMTGTAFPYPSSFGNALFTQSMMIVDGTKSAIGVLPCMLFVDSMTAGKYDSVINEDVLLLTVMSLSDDFGPLGNFAFYLGG